MRALAFSLTLIAVLAPTAFAQHKFEISPYGGIRTAGSFRGEDQLVSYNVALEAHFTHQTGPRYIEPRRCLRDAADAIPYALRTRRSSLSAHAESLLGVLGPRRVQKYKRTLRPARRSGAEFIYHYRGEPNHQGLGNAFVFLDTTGSHVY